MRNIHAPPEKKDRESTYSPVRGRNLPVLVVSAFLLGGASLLFKSLLQPLILLLGGSIAIVGIVVSISDFSRLAAQVVFGEYSDAVGRRQPLLIASLLLVAGGLLFWIAPNYVIIIPAVLMTGFALALNEPASSAATAESVPSSRRGRAFSFRSAGRFLAGVVASIFGIIVMQWGNVQSAFLLFTIFVLINLGLIYFLFTETLVSPRSVSPASLFRNLRKHLRIMNPKLKVLYIYAAITDPIGFGLGWHIIYGLLADFQGVTSQQLLLYTMGMNLVAWAVQFGVASRLVDRTRKGAIVLSDLIAVPTILGCALFPAGKWTFPVAFLLMGVAVSFWIPAVQAFVVDHAREQIAAEFGKLWGFRGIVSLFPPILGGILAAKYGYSAPLLANFFVGVISISVVIFFLDRGSSNP